MTPVGSARYLIGPWYAGMYTFRTTRATDSAGLTPTPPHLTPAGGRPATADACHGAVGAFRRVRITTTSGAPAGAVRAAPSDEPAAGRPHQHRPPSVAASGVQRMDPVQKLQRILLLLIIAGLVTYVALLNPLLGVALLVGIGVAMFIHQLLG